MSIETLRSLYSKDLLTPDSVIKEVYKRLALPGADTAVWLHLIPEETSIALAQELLKKFPDPAARPPLFGIPFSIKDSIDIKGLPTTGACPAFAYTAEKDAPSYALLIEAGAIPIGKVNLVCAVFWYSLTIVSSLPWRQGSTCYRSCGHALTVRPTCIRLLEKSYFRRLKLRLVRQRGKQAGFVLVGHRYRRLRPSTSGVQQYCRIQTDSGNGAF